MGFKALRGRSVHNFGIPIHNSWNKKIRNLWDSSIIYGTASQADRSVHDGVFGQARHGGRPKRNSATASRTRGRRAPGEPAWRERARTDYIQAPRRTGPVGRLAQSARNSWRGALPAIAMAAPPGSRRSSRRSKTRSARRHAAIKARMPFGGQR